MARGWQGQATAGRCCTAGWAAIIYRGDFIAVPQAVHAFFSLRVGPWGWREACLPQPLYHTASHQPLLTGGAGSGVALQRC